MAKNDLTLDPNKEIEIDEDGKLQYYLDKLKQKQQNFVFAYVGEQASFNATKAAEISGYGTTYNSQAVEGHRLLKNVNIKGAIGELANMILHDRGLNKFRLLKVIADIAVTEIEDFMEFEENGIDFKWKIPKGKTAAVRSISYREVYTDEGMFITKYIDNITLKDNKWAVEMAAKLLKIDVVDAERILKVVFQDGTTGEIKDAPCPPTQVHLLEGEKEGN